MLKTLCLEFQRDWDEGVPLALSAVREVVQESLGFSPAELVFGHTVRCPLKSLKLLESWLSLTATARENLGICQKQMKRRYGEKAVSRTFQTGIRCLF